jgi:anti-anti-sigma factor
MAVAPDFNLDVVGAQKLDTVLDDIDPADGQCVVDLARVAFVASSGLRILLKQAQRLDVGGGELVVTNVSDVVAEVFEMSGFDQIITIR